MEHFKIKKHGPGLSRLGELECVHQNVITPRYAPVSPFIDSSDDSIRTEAISKTFPGYPALSMIMLHDDNGRLTRGQKNKLSIPQHKVHKHFHGPLFLDSGGFKLIRMNIDEISAREIFDIQVAIGGDVFYTLDYPLLKEMSMEMQVKRAKKSIENAILALKYRKEIWGNEVGKPLVYVAVHGTSVQFIRDYLDRFFKRLSEEDLEDMPFGLAQGSLVPLKSKRETVIEFLYTTKKYLIDRGLENQIPIHAFGVSGPLVPYLTLMGIDTFDSISFITSAGNHQILDPKTLDLISLRASQDQKSKKTIAHKLGLNPDDYTNLKEIWDCNCVWCRNAQMIKPQANENIIDFARTIQSIGKNTHSWRKIPEFANYLEERGFKTLDMLYVHIILHNLTVTHQMCDDIQDSLKKGKFGEYFKKFLEYKNYRGGSKEFRRSTKLLRPILNHDLKFRKWAEDNLDGLGDFLIEGDILEGKETKKFVKWDLDSEDTPLHPGKVKTQPKKLASLRKEDEQDFEEVDLI